MLILLRRSGLRSNDSLISPLTGSWRDCAGSRRTKRLSAGIGRSPSSCRWMRCSLDLTFRSHGPIINDLVGIACNAIGRRTASAPIEHLDSATAAWDAARMESLSRLEETSAETLTQEKWVEESVLNKVLGSQAQTKEMVNSGYAGGPAVDSALAKAKVNLMWIRYPKQKIAQDYVQYMDAEIRKASLPYYAATRAPEVRTPSDPLLQILDPIFAPLLFKEAYNQTFNALLMSQLALRAYKLDHQGHYPPTLTALTPKVSYRRTRRCVRSRRRAPALQAGAGKQNHIFCTALARMESTTAAHLWSTQYRLDGP